MNPTAVMIRQLLHRRRLPIMRLSEALHELRRQGRLLPREAVQECLHDPSQPLRLLHPWSGALHALTPEVPVPTAPLMRPPTRRPSSLRRRQRDRRPEPASAGSRAAWIAREQLRAERVSTPAHLTPLPPAAIIVARPAERTTEERTLSGFRSVARSVACLGYHLWPVLTRDRARWLRLYEEAERLIS